jgi:Ser/Thr protein kinase RdoA (MazF antagonist)
MGLRIERNPGWEPDQLVDIAARFAPGAKVGGVFPLGNGHINDTFLVSLEDPAVERFVLQRINGRVFHQPESVMGNMGVVTQHGRERLKGLAADSGFRFELPRVLSAADGRDHWLDGSGSFWRAISFIEGSRSFDAVQDLDHAREVGRALGIFHTIMNDLPIDFLVDTLPGFHVTPAYLRHYDEVLTSVRIKASPEVALGQRFVNERRSWVPILENARSQGLLQLRPIHGDPKVGNVMIDSATHRAVSLVDLDTVKPGLVHYDIGDCLRSCCNPLGGDAEDWESVHFEPELCRAALQGYLAYAAGFLSGHDVRYLYDAIRLIAFELGLRFLTDHLEGDSYFKPKRPNHNLHRALVQFKLAESIELQAKTIQNIISELQ